MKEAEERIRDTATDSILAIRKREKEMVTNLYDAFGEDGINFLKEKQPLQVRKRLILSTSIIVQGFCVKEVRFGNSDYSSEVVPLQEPEHIC